MIVECLVLGAIAWKALGLGSVAKAEVMMRQIEKRPKRRTVETKNGRVSVLIDDFVDEEGRLVIHHAVVDGVVMTAAELQVASAARQYRVARALGVSREHLFQLLEEMLEGADALRADIERMKSRRTR